MAQIRIENFSALAPRIGDRLLPDTYATGCVNARFYSGELRGMRAVTPAQLLHTFGDGETKRFVARVKANDGTEGWFGSPDELTSIAANPLVDEAFDRLYIFEPGVPVKVSTVAGVAASDTPDPLALPYPTVAPTLTPEGTITNTDVVENRVYLYTWQTTWGEETIPSPAETVQVRADSAVQVSGLEQPTALAPTAATSRQWDRINIYRSAAGSLDTAFYFVASVPVGTTSYRDDIRTGYVVYNGTLQSFDNVSPPDGLQGVRTHPSGTLVAFKGRHVYFSKPYLPHAWPPEQRVAVDDAVVGVEVYGQDVIVMTESYVYQIYGSVPTQLGLRKFAFVSPCVHYRSIVSVERGVYFCSPHGLVLVNENGPTRVTKDIATEEEWQRDFAGGDVHAVWHDQQYMALPRDPTKAGWLWDERPQSPVFCNWDQTGGVEVSTIALDIYGDRVLVAQEDDVSEWDALEAPKVPYTWRSRDFQLPAPVNFGAIYVHGPQHPILEVTGGIFNATSGASLPKPVVRVRVWARYQKVFDEVIEVNEMRRLPTGFKADVWTIEVTSCADLHTVALAETGKELARA